MGKQWCIQKFFGEADLSTGFFFFGGGGGGGVMPHNGSRAKSWWGPGSKAPESSNDLVLWDRLLLIKAYPPQPVMKLIQHIFFKILPKCEFEVNFSVQSCASLTREDPAYLIITYVYVYYLKYTELKSFFGHRVWALKPVYRLLNTSGYVYGK